VTIILNQKICYKRKSSNMHLL